MRDPPLIQDLLDAKAILLEILRRRHNAGGILFGREGGGAVVGFRRPRGRLSIDINGVKSE